MGQQFSINPRILSEILAKYPNTFSAICELFNNSIQAKATEIRIEIDYAAASELSASTIRKITVADNGVGVSKAEFKWKILEVGTKAKAGGQGIGRFASLQLGAKMRIETVAFDQNEKTFFKSELPLDIGGWQDESLEKIPLNDTYTPLEGKQAPYYKVTIEDFYGEDVGKREKHKRVAKSLLADNIEAAIFAAYPEKIFQRSVKFIVNGNPINPDNYIVGKVESSKEEFVGLDGEKFELGFQFVQVKTTGKHRVFLRVANSGLQTVAHTFDYQLDVPEPNQWFVLVDSPLFDEHTDSIRNLQLYEIDPHAEHLFNEIKRHVDSFFQNKYADYKNFLQRLRDDNFYPYKLQKASSESRTALFNQLAYYVEEKHHLLSGGQKIRELVYALLDKALNSGEFEVLLEHVIKLDKSLVGRFRDLLGRVDLEDVIAFSEEIVRKQQFLDFLHKLVYGEIAKHVKERSQLHKILEKHLWVFGEQYNGTPRLFSDKNLANNLEALRNELFNSTPSNKDGNLVKLADEKAKNITDLFFYNEKIMDNQKREILVVELKAPKVRLTDKEFSQARRYALQIEKGGVFPTNHFYKIVLVGSEMSDSAKASCGLIDPQNPYLFHKSKVRNIEVWAIHWADLFAHNRTKLTYLGNALGTKDRDVRQVFESEFQDVELQKLDTVLESSKDVPLGRKAKRKK